MEHARRGRLRWRLPRRGWRPLRARAARDQRGLSDSEIRTALHPTVDLGQGVRRAPGASTSGSLSQDDTEVSTPPGSTRNRREPRLQLRSRPGWTAVVLAASSSGGLGSLSSDVNARWRRLGGVLRRRCEYAQPFNQDLHVRTAQEHGLSRCSAAAAASARSSRARAGSGRGVRRSAISGTATESRCPAPPVRRTPSARSTRAALDCVVTAEQRRRLGEREEQHEDAPDQVHEEVPTGDRTHDRNPDRATEARDDRKQARYVYRRHSTAACSTRTSSA